MYTIILNNGEIWQFTHKDIRVKDNVTFNRVFNEERNKPKETPWNGTGGTLHNSYTTHWKESTGVTFGTPLMGGTPLTAGDISPSVGNKIRTDGGVNISSNTPCSQFIPDGFNSPNQKCMNCGLMKINHPSKTIIAGV
jgi:hypothetical protein